MKKYLFLGALAAMLLGTTACNDDVIDAVSEGAEVPVQFVANLGDGIDSRAISDGTKADQLKFFVYEDGELIPSLSQTVTVANKQATISTKLVRGHKYSFVFWAQNSTTNAYALGYAAALDRYILQVRYNTAGNDENRDAFFHVLSDYQVTGSFTEDIVLHRPLAQLNIIATDAASVTDLENYGSAVSVTNMPYLMTQLTGEATNFGRRSFDKAALPTEKLPGYEGDQYQLVATNYFLASDERTLSNVNFTLSYGNKNRGITIENVPLQRNYRTNIIGDFFTEGANYTIVIDPMYVGDMGEVSTWDGVTVENPELNETTGKYEVKSAEQLAGFAKMVNEGNNFSGKTVVLDADINLDNQVWTPIGPSTAKAFSGTFDGQGHSIFNLNVAFESYGRGFFSNIVGPATVKNVTIRNSTVGDRSNGNIYGVLAGYAYGTVTFENVHILNSTVRGFGKVGGIVGMAADPGGTTTFRNCSVDYTTVRGTYNVGGIMGLAQNQTVIENCEVNNINFVLDDDADTYAKYTAADGYTVTKGGNTVAVEGIYWKYPYGSDLYLFAALSLYYCDYYYEDTPINGMPEGNYISDGLCHGLVDYQF